MTGYLIGAALAIVVAVILADTWPTFDTDDDDRLPPRAYL